MERKSCLHHLQFDLNLLGLSEKFFSQIKQTMKNYWKNCKHQEEKHPSKYPSFLYNSGHMKHIQYLRIYQHTEK